MCKANMRLIFILFKDVQKKMPLAYLRTAFFDYESKTKNRKILQYVNLQYAFFSENVNHTSCKHLFYEKLQQMQNIICQ